MIEVNPNRPVSFRDFTELYTGNPAMTPDQVESDLFFNAPLAGRSYLKQQWDRLGINEPPERFFSNPANLDRLRAATAASGPTNVGTISPRNPSPSDPYAREWPQFQTTAERNMAMLSGNYDPNFPSPLKRTEYVSGLELEKQAQQRAQAAAVAAAPAFIPRYLQYPGASGAEPQAYANPEELIRAQRAGDISGVASKFLRKQAGVGELDEISAPYDAEGGYGYLNADTTKDLLDRNVYNDSDFQRLLAKDPEQANFVYQRLTGRNLSGDKGDLATAQSFRADRAKFTQSLLDEQTRTLAGEETKEAIRKATLANKTGQEYTAQQLKSGATYDPVKGTWMVWNQQDAPEGGISGLSAAGKPYRQYVPANKVQADYLNKHFKTVTGQDLPKRPAPASAAVQRHAMELEANPEIAAMFREREELLHRQLTDQEKTTLQPMIEAALQQKRETELRSSTFGTWDTPGTVSQAFVQMGNAMLGISNAKSSPTQALPDLGGLDIGRAYSDPTGDSLNWWGKFIKGIPDAIPSVPDMSPVNYARKRMGLQ